MPGPASMMKTRHLRVVIFILVIVTIILALYHLYQSSSYDIKPSPTPSVRGINDVYRGPDYYDKAEDNVVESAVNHNYHSESKGYHPVEYGSRYTETNFTGEKGFCMKINPFVPSIDANAIYPTLGFDEEWISRKEYWNPYLEKRYVETKKSTEKPYMKIVVVPHSHNDPGWLRTFEGYYFAQTKNILDNVVEKLTEHKNMTFLWSEISFLNKWWKSAHPTRRKLFKNLVDEGRLEMVTGGWVMTDEATVNLFSMVDQLVEGHQWIQSHLGVKPKSSWSIDPFGHGSTLPFVLKRAGLNGMVIQRIHYAWKKWFAENQAGDFEWVQRWDTNQQNSILCHNAPFDIYSIKHSCGPHPMICLNFDFRNITGEYMENYRISVPITRANVRERAELLLEQYGKTASLFPHNVAMISLGDDFRYDKSLEWDQQYTNYMALFNYINANKDTYRAEVGFGTVSDYFKAIRDRYGDFNTFSGDFFVYSDIFSEGRPAYWSGYFGTRPYWKKFYRETENQIRNTEFLFTIAYNLARQKGERFATQVYEQEYNHLVVARQWLALFAHHDATTGTSKVATMDDYGHKLMEATQTCQNIQITAMNSILFGQTNATRIVTDYELSAFGELPRKIPLKFSRRDGKELIQNVVVFNNLGWTRSVYTKVVVPIPHVQVLGPDGKAVVSQLNPILDVTGSAIHITSEVYELTFLAELEPYATATYTVRRTKPGSKFAATKAAVYCRNCNSPGRLFDINRIQEGDIQLNNDHVQLLFDRETGMLQSITKLQESIKSRVKLSFGGYSSIDFRSGAYLLALNTRSKMKIPFDGTDAKIFITSGPIASELTVFQDPIALCTRLMHDGGKKMQEAIYMENKVDLGHQNTEMYMRFQTDLNSQGKIKPNSQSTVPVFYTDQNGFATEKRIRVAQVGLQGNYYPVNTMAFIQDEQSQLRFTILVDRSHGFSSFELGRLETLVERRTLYDDSRGMGEGVTDNRPTISNYVILLEKISIDPHSDLRNSLATKAAVQLSHELIYTPPTFVYSNTIDTALKPVSFQLFNQPLPCDTHVLNFRTLTRTNENIDIQLPRRQALMVLQKFAFNCHPDEKSRCGNTFFYPNTVLSYHKVASLRRTDLTGVAFTGSNFTHLHQVSAEPFDLSSVLVTFAH